ncbi:MAG: N-acetylmuramoyl-L-alanine amidase [Bacteroidales bacterium]|nr:N-acetylmuramoyl-L-alanine amidase [Bacteroidales bacterium]
MKSENRNIPSFVKVFLVFSLFFFFQNVLLAQTANKKVVAKSGDGIYSMLRRNDLNPNIYFNDFVELNKNKLGKGQSLYEGRTYLLPGKKEESTLVKTQVKPESKAVKPKTNIKTVVYPIFGDKYSRIEIKDNKLKGTVYYLIAGHGGPDPGALGKYGSNTLSEDEYAYDVSLRLARYLIEHGALVYMIIRDKNDGIRDQSILKLDKDEVCFRDKPIPYNHKERLRQRTQAVNNLYAKNKGKYQRLVIIHLDSQGKGNNMDVYFYYHERSKSGKRLAKNIQDTFRQKYAKYQPNRSYTGSMSSRSSLYVLRNTHPPTVFIELGNIRNAHDQQRFVISDNREALGTWIGDGILLDYNSR